MPPPGLSCYTANLYHYLAAEWDAAAIIAGSIRLAVRFQPPDGLAFSHHEPSLDRLPDGTYLRYAGGPTPAAVAPDLAAEIAEHGRVLVVADSARLAWSLTRAGPSAPHWLLIDDHDGTRWHVVDGFTALLPAGEQLPYRGWLSTAQLAEVMTLPGRWDPVLHLRNVLAFGSPVEVPPTPAVWLRRGCEPPCPDADVVAPGHDGAASGWLSGDRQVLPRLADAVVRSGVARWRHLDDLWAAAGHRCFAYRWRLAGAHEAARPALQAALARWEQLPRLVRVAAESAQRGRPRASLVRMALLELLRAEEDLSCLV
jgi:hypothetical protein